MRFHSFKGRWPMYRISQYYINSGHYRGCFKSTKFWLVAFELITIISFKREIGKERLTSIIKFFEIITSKT